MKKLTKTLVFAAIGFAVGFVIGKAASNGDSAEWIFALLGMGVPFGWSFLNRWFGHTIIGGGLAGIFILTSLRAILSALIGWVILPIEIGKGIYEIVTNRNEALAGETGEKLAQ